MTDDIVQLSLSLRQLNVVRRMLRGELDRHRAALRTVGTALSPDDERAVEGRIAELRETLDAIEAPIADIVERISA